MATKPIPTSLPQRMRRPREWRVDVTRRAAEHQKAPKNWCFVALTDYRAC